MTWHDETMQVFSHIRLLQLGYTCISQHVFVTQKWWIKTIKNTHFEHFGKKNGSLLCSLVFSFLHILVCTFINIDLINSYKFLRLKRCFLYHPSNWCRKSLCTELWWQHVATISVWCWLGTCGSQESLRWSWRESLRGVSLWWWTSPTLADWSSLLPMWKMCCLLPHIYRCTSAL